jgi:hypothetical protein
MNFEPYTADTFTHVPDGGAHGGPRGGGPGVMISRRRLIAPPR